MNCAHAPASSQYGNTPVSKVSAGCMRVRLCGGDVLCESLRQVIKRWVIFCPLVGELSDPSMRPAPNCSRDNHVFCGAPKSVLLGPDIGQHS